MKKYLVHVSWDNHNFMFEKILAENKNLAAIAAVEIVIDNLGSERVNEIKKLNPVCEVCEYVENKLKQIPSR